MERRSFLKGLALAPFVPALLKGMDWAAPTPAVAAARGTGGYSCVVPAGTVLLFSGAEAPPGFLPCDGREIPLALYPKLYSAIGDAYGAPRRRWRIRRFHVPDLRARLNREDPKVAAGGVSFREAIQDPAMYTERPIDLAIRYVIKS
jgi:hypothetical protein